MGHIVQFRVLRTFICGDDSQINRVWFTWPYYIFRHSILIFSFRFQARVFVYERAGPRRLFIYSIIIIIIIIIIELHQPRHKEHGVSCL